MAKRKKTDFVQFKIRFRESLRSRLEIAAKGQERSLNSEIVARLEQSFDRESVTRIRDQAEKVLESILDQNRRRSELVEIEAKQAVKRTGDPDHAEQFWSRHPQVSPEDLSRIQSEALNKAAQEEFDRGHTEVADWLWQQARDAASGRLPRSDYQEREDLRRRLLRARTDSPPDQEPELPMPRMPRRESSK